MNVRDYIIAVLTTIIITFPVAGSTVDEHRQILDAIRQVETGGEPDGGRNATGDNGASIGPYQIQKAYWMDSGIPGKWEDCRDKDYAEKVMLAYWKRYVPEALKQHDHEVLARTHNGGPKGSQRKATIPYWHKVKKILEKP